MDDHTTERSFDSQGLCRSLMCLAYFLDMLSMNVCTTRLFQTSGRLVQELNVCTVGVLIRGGAFNSGEGAILEDL